MCTKTQGESSDSIGAWVRPTCWSHRVSWGGRGQLWLTVGTRTLVEEALGNIHWHELSWRLPFWHQDLAPTACRLQCWDASGEMTNMAGTEPHPSVDRLPKDFLSPQPPLDMPLDMALPSRGPRPSPTHHQWASISPSHQEAYTSL